MAKGKFITFEGCEGAGKSKQLRLISEYLRGQSKDFVVVREPGSTVISEQIREIILNPVNLAMTAECEVFLYMAARAQLVREVIRPALKAGKLVICDRYIDSSLAYQGFARGLGSERIEQLNSLAIAECVPDCTVFLDLSPEEAFKRKGGADKTDRLESEDISFHDRVYQGYKFAEAGAPERFLNIKPTGTVLETHLEIVRALTARGMLD